MPQRIFITGATGYLGSALTARFVRAGHEVHGLTRAIEGARTIAALGAQPVVGDLSDPESWIGDLQNCDVAVHAAVDYSDAAGQDQKALEAVRAASQDGRIRTLLYTSGLWDHGAVQDRVVDETTPLAPLPLVRWRAAHHDVALDLAEFEVRVVILELGMIYGEHRGILGRMFAEGREKHVVTLPGNGEQVWSLVHREDAADAFALAFEHAAHGDRFLLTDESLLTARQIADSIARVTGATVKPWPKAEVLEKLGPYGEALLASVRVTSARARRELGWVPRHTSFTAEADDLYREWQKGLNAPVS